MLVIPAIEIQHNRCLRAIHTGASAGGDVYSDDPGKMAMVWRKENAKVLHLTDYDGLYAGHLDNVEEVLRVVRAVEIPVQLVSRFADVEECRMWLDSGVYRLVVHDLLQRDTEGMRALIESYGASRIAAGVISRKGRICATWRDVAEVDILEFVALAESLGIVRIFFTDRDYEGVLHGPNYDELHRIATATSIHITAAGGIATVEHLWKLQQMESLGIDSVVIGRAFYENRFPCQQLWRDVELEQRNRGAQGDVVSTSTLSSDAAAPDAG